MFKPVNDARQKMKEFFTQALNSYSEEDDASLKSYLMSKAGDDGKLFLGSLFTGCGGQDEAIKVRVS